MHERKAAIYILQLFETIKNHIKSKKYIRIHEHFIKIFYQNMIEKN